MNRKICLDTNFEVTLIQSFRIFRAGISKEYLERLGRITPYPEQIEHKNTRDSRLLGMGDHVCQDRNRNITKEG